MSDDVDDASARLAAAFDQDQDPLAGFERDFEALDVDPFELFVVEAVEPRDVVDSTIEGYRRTHRQWRAFMAEASRHPACPAESHVSAFVDHLAETQENHPKTIKAKLRKLNETHQYWQQAPAFPHPVDFNPFALAMTKVSFDVDTDQKELPSLSLSELRGVLGSISHLRDRLIVLLQLKLGLRASELCNIKLAEIDVQSQTVRSGYPDLGSHRALSGRPNAIYVPHDRARNKSCRPRVLPLDGESQDLLERYLVARPDTGAPWLFLSKHSHNQLMHVDVNDVWTDAFRPMYAETEHHRAVGSHFGRHFFTTYWRIEAGIDRQLLRYMRSDRAEGETVLDRNGIDEYLHTYYEDIEAIYREGIFQLSSSYST